MERLAYVPQRRSGDCAVASLATVTGRSYENMAALLGLQDFDNGLAAFALPFPLLRAGFAATTLFPAEVGVRFGMTGGLASRAGIAAFLSDRSAVLLMNIEAQDMPDHAIAWHRGRLIDGRFGVIGDTLDGVQFEAALVISPLASLATASQPEPVVMQQKEAA